MKRITLYMMILFVFILMPSKAYARTYNNSTSNVLAVLNDVLDPEKLKYVILGMIAVILLLIGSALFGKNK